MAYQEVKTQHLRTEFVKRPVAVGQQCV